MWEIDGLINCHREDGSVYTIRLCLLREDGLAIGIIDIADRKADLHWISRLALEDELASGDATLCTTDPYVFLRDPKYDDPRHPKAKQYAEYAKKRDRNYRIIEPLVSDPRIFLPRQRGRLIEARARQCKCTEKHVRTLLRRYFQRGQMKNALLPDFDNSGRGRGIRGPRVSFLGKTLQKLKCSFTDKDNKVRTVTGLYALFVPYLEKYFDKKGWSLSETLDELHGEVFNCGFTIQDGHKVPILKPVDQMPALEHLKYFYRRYWNKDTSRRTRKGDIEYGNTSRPRNKGTQHMAQGPGQLIQGDATPPDIVVVDSIRRTEVLGKATIYFLIDHFSHLVCGFSISLRNECYVSVMMALDHMSTDKVEYCKGMGITIARSEWPVANVPRRILVDNGVLRQWKGSHLVNALNIRVVNTPAYRGDLKGLVERFNLSIKKRIRRLRGTTIQAKAGKKRRPAREAVSTIEDLTKHVITEVLCHNNTMMTKYRRTKDMIRDRVPRIPSHIWAWGCKKALGKPRWLSQDTLRLNLLPLVQGTVTDDGLVVEGALYTCPDHLCAKARQEGRFKVFVNRETRAPSEVFLRDPANDRNAISCVLQDEALRGLDSAEITLLQADEKALRKQWESHDAQQRATRDARHRAISQTATKQHNKALKEQGLAHNDDKHVAEARAEGIRLENEVGAWRDLGDKMDATTDQVNREKKSAGALPPSNKYADALRMALEE